MSEKDLELDEQDEIIELIDEFGNKTEFYLIGTMDYKEKNYAFFQPAEEIEGSDPDDVVIFEITEADGGMLLPIEDEDLLQEIFDEFVKEYDSEYPEYEEDDKLLD